MRCDGGVNACRPVAIVVRSALLSVGQRRCDAALDHSVAHGLEDKVRCSQLNAPDDPLLACVAAHHDDDEIPQVRAALDLLEQLETIHGEHVDVEQAHAVVPILQDLYAVLRPVDGRDGVADALKGVGNDLGIDDRVVHNEDVALSLLGIHLGGLMRYLDNEAGFVKPLRSRRKWIGTRIKDPEIEEFIEAQQAPQWKAAL